MRQGVTKESKVVLKVCFTITLEDSINITTESLVIVKHTFVKFAELEKILFIEIVGVML